MKCNKVTVINQIKALKDLISYFHLVISSLRDALTKVSDHNFRGFFCQNILRVLQPCVLADGFLKKMRAIFLYTVVEIVC